MKNLAKLLAMVSTVALLATSLSGCGGACADLEKKKADCASNKEPIAKDACEKVIDGTVKAGNNDACKAALDAMAKK
jgi:hypothetical protein